MSLDVKLLNQPIVLDNGTHSIKSGFAGSSTPHSVTFTQLGTPKYPRILTSSTLTATNDTFIGSQAQQYRGLLSLRSPMSKGEVINWRDLEKIWEYVISQELRLNTGIEEHPMLITEGALINKINREKMAEIMFENYGSQACYFAVQGVLGLYSTGRTSGVVVNCGEGVSEIIPVCEGFQVSGGARRVDVNGRDVCESLQLLLRKRGVNLSSSAEFEIVREIKEKCGFISKDISNQETLDDEKLEKFKLPDGNVIQLGKERYRSSELLFNPQIIGIESNGIHEVLHSVIQRCDIDLRSQMNQNIILSGGVTLTKGFGDRLLSESKKLNNKGVKLKIFAPPERKYSVWIGGSILAGLSTFKRIWVAKKEWEEDPGIVHVRCL